MNFDLNYIFDFFVLLVILVSSLLSFWRGILKELLIIFIWIISILLTYIIFPNINSFISEYINFNPLSILISLLIPFITILLILSVINSFIIFPLLYPLNGLTNSLIGFAFGLVRGALIICILYYFSSLSETFSELINNNFKSSFSLEYINFITEYILNNIPKNFNYNFLNN
tara:strand:+ start:95 stop:610 length:516 start_codon:yes stop_codon:yes gene_type:complete